MAKIAHMTDGIRAQHQTEHDVRTQIPGLHEFRPHRQAILQPLRCGLISLPILNLGCLHPERLLVCQPHSRVPEAAQELPNSLRHAQHTIAIGHLDPDFLHGKQSIPDSTRRHRFDASLIAELVDAWR